MRIAVKGGQPIEVEIPEGAFVIEPGGLGVAGGPEDPVIFAVLARSPMDELEPRRTLSKEFATMREAALAFQEGFEVLVSPSRDPSGITLRIANLLLSNPSVTVL
jgi:hypothetical protein